MRASGSYRGIWQNAYSLYQGTEGITKSIPVQGILIWTLNLSQKLTNISESLWQQLKKFDAEVASWRSLVPGDVLRELIVTLSFLDCLTTSTKEDFMNMPDLRGTFKSEVVISAVIVCYSEPIQIKGVKMATRMENATINAVIVLCCFILSANHVNLSQEEVSYVTTRSLGSLHETSYPFLLIGSKELWFQFKEEFII